MTPQELFGRRVAELRRRQGKTLKQLSRDLGDIGINLDVQGLSRLITGERRTALDEFVALCHALSVPPAYMLTDDDKTEVTVGDLDPIPGDDFFRWVVGEKNLDDLEFAEFVRSAPTWKLREQEAE